MAKCKYETTIMNKEPTDDVDAVITYKCPRNKDLNSDYCFLHNPDTSNTEKLKLLKKENNDKFEKIDLIGAELTGIDLSEVDLNGTELIYANLNNANLEKANLENADLTGATLEKANLTGANLTNTDFSDANLNTADLRAAILKRTNFFMSDLRGTDCRGIFVDQVILYMTRLDGADFLHAFWRKKKQIVSPSIYLIDASSASYLKNFYKEKGQFKLSDHFYVKQLSSQRQDQPKWKQPLYLLWWSTARYGVSVWRWAMTSILLAFGFGLIFCYNPGLLHYSEVKSVSDFTPFYYSIVTFTTLGFGDVIPVNIIGEILVTIEVILGYMMLGGLIAIFANKFTRT